MMKLERLEAATSSTEDMVLVGGSKTDEPKYQKEAI